jgi:methionyl-tRNA formyltransferase
MGIVNKLVLFADKKVGCECARFLLGEYPDLVGLIVLIDRNSPLHDVLNEYEYPEGSILYWDDLSSPKRAFNSLKRYQPDIFILAWWPQLLKSNLINIPHLGCLNFHPSLLPYNRGKHPNFWSIVEGTPFGVSLHFIDEKIDQGQIVFQQEIPYDWEDNGESLHKRSIESIVLLFKEKFPLLKEGVYEKKKPSEIGSFHYAKEIDSASEINLEKEYKAKDLLNLLRARTFPPYQSCYFYDNDECFRVTVSIKKDKNGPG